MQERSNHEKIGKVGPYHSQAIENVYNVEELKHNLLSVSQMCDKENDVLFTSTACKITNSNSKKLILMGKSIKIVYKVDIMGPEMPML